MFDGKAFGVEIVSMVREYVEQATAPLLARIGALEKELADRPSPQDGKDADPALVGRLVAEAIAAIPPAKDGESIDPEAVKAMVDEAVAKALIPSPEAIEATKTRWRAADEAMQAESDKLRIFGMKLEALGEIGEDGLSAEIAEQVKAAVALIPVPADGKSFTAEDAAPLIAEEVARAVSALPAAEPGKDADPEAVRAMVDEAVSALPAPKDGKDADQAAIISEVVAALEPVIAEQIAGLEVDDAKLAGLVDEAVAKIPAPADGKSITPDDVAPLIGEAVEKAVAALPAPKDGTGLAGALIDRAGHLVVTLTDGSQRELGPVIGKDGEPGKDAEPGKDGADGLGFDDLDLSFDGERKLVATFTKGEVSKAIEIEFPVIIDRGVYKAGKAYLRGDAVTWGGALWIAQRDTSDKPETSDAFRLAVKMGRNGQDGKNGERGEKGDPGRDGKALT